MTETTADTAAETATPDMELIDKTLDAIDRNPDAWDQYAWRCTTGMCFAGTAATLAGAPWATDIHGRLPDRRFIRTHLGDMLEDLGANLVRVPGARYIPDRRALGDFAGDYVDDVEHVKEWARRRLGLTTAQAAAMFDPDNDEQDLAEFRDRLAADPTDDLSVPGRLRDWEIL